MSNALFQAAMHRYLAPDAPPSCPDHRYATYENPDQSRRCTHPGCAWNWQSPQAVAMSQYLAEEARAADMTPLHERMFGHALEPDPDFSCDGIDTDPGFYPGGPLVIEKSGADAAVRAIEIGVYKQTVTEMWAQLFKVSPSLVRLIEKKPAPDIASITRDIARGS